MGASGRLTVLCQAVPYPPTDGGRADAWHLVRGLTSLGVEAQLVCWLPRGEHIPASDRDVLERVVSDVIEVPTREGWWRLLYAKYPPKMLSCTATRGVYADLLRRVDAFQPDWVMLDTWRGYLAGLRLAGAIRAPLIYRSANVEYLYFRDLARVARGTLRLKLRLNALRMFRLERRMRTTSDLVLDIAEPDAEHWRTMGGAGNCLVVRPVWLDAPPQAAIPTQRDIDIVFIGNLRTPNNLAGLAWFADRVLPVLRVLHSEPLTVVFAGSAPDPLNIEAWGHSGIRCIADPVEVGTLYARATVAINPLQRGSGVNMKMIEILASGCFAVTTSAGFRGLPEGLRQFFEVADSPERFAAALYELLRRRRDRSSPVDRAAVVERYFGAARLAPLITAMKGLKHVGAPAATDAASPLLRSSRTSARPGRLSPRR